MTGNPYAQVARGQFGSTQQTSRDEGQNLFEAQNVGALSLILNTLKQQHFKIGDWKEVQKTQEALSLIINENKEVFGRDIQELFFDATWRYKPGIAPDRSSDQALASKNQLDLLLLQAKQIVAITQQSTQTSTPATGFNWLAGGFGGFGQRVQPLIKAVDEISVETPERGHEHIF